MKLSMILVTGAAGKTGKTIISYLIKSGISVKALINKNEYKQKLSGLGVDDFVIGNMNEQAVIRKALKGVSSVYHICPNANPNEYQIGKLIIDEAIKAGLQHFMYHSVLHPQISDMPHHWNKLLVEEMLIKSGLQYTILQPAIYMQNILPQIEEILQKREIELPYNTETRLSMVDLEDVGEVLSKVVLNCAHYYAVYPLVGVQSITYQEICETISQNFGIDIKIRNISIESWEKKAYSLGMPAEKISILSRMFDYYNKFGLIGNKNNLDILLNRQPTDFDQFINRDVH